MLGSTHADEGGAVVRVCVCGVGWGGIVRRAGSNAVVQRSCSYRMWSGVHGDDGMRSAVMLPVAWLCVKMPGQDPGPHHAGSRVVGEVHRTFLHALHEAFS